MPRITILGLLWLTAYAGVNFAAYAQPLGYWPATAMLVGAIILLHLVAAVVVARGAALVFAKGMLLGFIVSAAFWHFEPYLILPQYNGNSFIMGGENLEIRIWEVRQAIVLQSWNLGFGALGGALAIWRHRRQELKDQSVQSGTFDV